MNACVDLRPLCAEAYADTGDAATPAACNPSRPAPCRAGSTEVLEIER